MMMDLSAQPVTPQELDAWLRSTDVDDEPDQQQQQPLIGGGVGHKTSPPLPSLGQSPPPALPTKTQSKTATTSTSHHPPSSGRPHSEERHDGHDDAPEVIRLVSEGNDSYSPASSINSAQAVDRDAALSMEPAPMFTMERRCSNAGGGGGGGTVGGGLHNRASGNKGNGCLPPGMLRRRDSAGSRCSATCASSDTAVRNYFSRSSVLNNNRGYDCVTPLGNNSATSPASLPMQLHRSNTSPYQEEEGNSGAGGGGYARSISLPGNNSHSQFENSTAALQHSHSLPTCGPMGRRHSSQVDSVCQSNANVAQDHYQFLTAMEKSQKSQEYIHSGPQTPCPTYRRNLTMMRETNRSRGLLLSVLGGKSSSGRNSRRSSMGTPNGNCFESRRASASQVIAAHNNAHDPHGNHNSSISRRASANAVIGANMHHLRNSKPGMGSWRQQDMRNMMLRSMQMNEEDMMNMGGKKMEDSCRPFGAYWRPAHKNHHNQPFSSPNYGYPSKNHQQQHQQMRMPSCPEEDFDQESAVKAELQRIAREQMMKMEQHEQQQLQSIY